MCQQSSVRRLQKGRKGKREGQRDRGIDSGKGREKEERGGEGERESREGEQNNVQANGWTDRQADRQMSLPMSWQDLKLQVPEGPTML